MSYELKINNISLLTGGGASPALLLTLLLFRI